MIPLIPSRWHWTQADANRKINNHFHAVCDGAHRLSIVRKRREFTGLDRLERRIAPTTQWVRTWRLILQVVVRFSFLTGWSSRNSLGRRNEGVITDCNYGADSRRNHRPHPVDYRHRRYRFRACAAQTTRSKLLWAVPLPH